MSSVPTLLSSIHHMSMLPRNATLSNCLVLPLKPIWFQPTPSDAAMLFHTHSCTSKCGVAKRAGGLAM